MVERGNLSRADELEFTYQKICSNFSNYSAWHYRSKLIEFLYKENQIDLDIFKKELNLIEQALFTDPNDQSKFYQLLSFLSNVKASQGLPIHDSPHYKLPFFKF